MSSQAGCLAGLVKLADQTAGRDKLCRVVQYSSRFVWWVMEKRDVNEELVRKVMELDKQLSTARKLFRFGKSVDHMRKALMTIHLTDPMLRFVITLSQINRAFYLLFDHLQWIGKIGLVKVDMDRWKKLSAKFWLVALILGLARDAYEILLAFQLERKRQRDTSHSKEEPPLFITFLNTLQHNPAIVLDTVKNGADFFIPTTQIGLVHVPSGIIGLLGTVSSLIALYTIWNTNTKLKYA